MLNRCRNNRSTAASSAGNPPIDFVIYFARCFSVSISVPSK